jgi:CopG family transcriptional regulator, nickel-responsive regulator
MKAGRWQLSMEVVSVSLPGDLLAELERVGARRGFKGRSELVRVALRQFVQDTPELDGHLHGSITIGYPHGREARMSEVRHAFHDVVLSMMHTHCEPETCMDVLLVGGEAQRVHMLVEALRRQRDVTKCVFAPITARAIAADPGAAHADHKH